VQSHFVAFQNLFLGAIGETEPTEVKVHLARISKIEIAAVHVVRIGHTPDLPLSKRYQTRIRNKAWITPLMVNSYLLSGWEAQASRITIN